MKSETAVAEIIYAEGESVLFIFRPRNIAGKPLEHFLSSLIRWKK